MPSSYNPGGATLPITVPDSTTAIAGVTSGALATDSGGNLTLDGTVIGGTTPADGNFASVVSFYDVVTSSNFRLSGGNATEIGQVGGSSGVITAYQLYGGPPNGVAFQFLNALTPSAPSGASNIYSSSGVMTVQNDGESAGLQVARIVGIGFYTGATPVTQGQVGYDTVSVTGALSTDLVIPVPTTVGGAGGWSIAGGVSVIGATASSGVVTLIFGNSDVTTSHDAPNVTVFILR